MGLKDFKKDDSEEKSPVDEVEEKAEEVEHSKLSTEELEKLDLYFEQTAQGELLKVKDRENALAHCYAPQLVKQLLRVDYEEVATDE